MGGESRASVPFKDIHDAAVPHVEALCKRWLASGKRQGSWWVCRTPWRSDENASLGVSLTTGRWRDFATGDKGDLTDLYARIYGGTPVEAARAVARVVGHSF